VLIDHQADASSTDGMSRCQAVTTRREYR